MKEEICVWNILQMLTVFHRKFWVLLQIYDASVRIVRQEKDYILVINCNWRIICKTFGTTLIYVWISLKSIFSFCRKWKFLIMFFQYFRSKQCGSFDFSLQCKILLFTFSFENLWLESHNKRKTVKKKPLSQL
jgi:hypothetical protein